MKQMHCQTQDLKLGSLSVNLGTSWQGQRVCWYHLSLKLCTGFGPSLRRTGNPAAMPLANQIPMELTLSEVFNHCFTHSLTMDEAGHMAQIRFWKHYTRSLNPEKNEWLLYQLMRRRVVKASSTYHPILLITRFESGAMQTFFMANQCWQPKK